MSRTYLISCDYLKSHTSINNNVDNTLLNNAIWEAQTIHIQQITGSELYNKVIDLVVSGDIQLPANSGYKNLLDDFLQPTIAYWAWYESIPYVSFKIVNKGVELQNSDYSNNTQLNQMEYLRDEIRNKAEFYSQRMVTYLKNNRSSYPEYNSGHDDLNPTNNQYFSGIQFDRNCGCCLNKQ